MTLDQLETAYLHQHYCELYVPSARIWIPVFIQGFHLNKGHNGTIYGVPQVRVTPVLDIHIAQAILDREFTCIKAKGYMAGVRTDRYIKTVYDEDILTLLRLKEQAA